MAVRSGRTGALLYDVFGTDDDERLGWSLAAMTDVNLDGWPDFVAGAEGASSNGTDCGAVRLLSGKDGAMLGEIAGVNGNDRMGAAVASMGDWDRDGISDFAAGAPKAGSLSNGEVQVFSGATLTPLWGGEGTIGPPCTSASSSDTRSRPATGTGWPGTFYEPTLTPLVEPVFGQTLDVQLTSSAPASTTALLLVGFSATDLPTGWGGRLYVVPFASIPVPLPPSGATLSADLPGIQTDLYVQALVLDAGASDGVAFTSGLHLRVGYDL